MIKYHIFKFPPIDAPEPWVCFPAFGPILEQHGDVVRERNEVNIHLDPDKTYQLSLDQSSTNSGIFIKDLWNSEAYMVEFKRAKNGNAGDYIWELEMLLHEICEGCNFSHIIYEKPIKGESFRSAEVLFQLEGMISTLPRRYQEFSAAKIDSIVNSSWREPIIDTKYNKFGRKAASKLSVEDLFPWSAEYGLSLYEDNDVFEAIGIMMGWFSKSFDPFGRPYIRGDKSSRPVGGFVLPGVKGAEAKAMLEKEGVDSDFVVTNPDYSICGNLTAGVKPYHIQCLEVTDKYTMLCLCIECNIKWFNPDVMTVILCDASTVDSTLKEIAGGKFHFIL